mmetsp:Transcript_6970/g.12640  ORF Transcript_6970/g.12640 Transcript_6970/m.12640 type:complete len:220 (-) Transcript_6970:189-848(-)
MRMSHVAPFPRPSAPNPYGCVAPVKAGGRRTTGYSRRPGSGAPSRTGSQVARASPRVGSTRGAPPTVSSLCTRPRLGTRPRRTCVPGPTHRTMAKPECRQLCRCLRTCRSCRPSVCPGHSAGAWFPLRSGRWGTPSNRLSGSWARRRRNGRVRRRGTAVTRWPKTPNSCTQRALPSRRVTIPSWDISQRGTLRWRRFQRREQVWPGRCDLASRGSCCWD